MQYVFNNFREIIIIPFGRLLCFHSGDYYDSVREIVMILFGRLL